MKVFNSEPVPVIVDDKGHVLAAGAHGTIGDSDRARRLIDAGRLVVVDAPKPDGQAETEPTARAKRS